MAKFGQKWPFLAQKWLILTKFNKCFKSIFINIDAYYYLELYWRKLVICWKKIANLGPKITNFGPKITNFGPKITNFGPKMVNLTENQKFYMFKKSILEILVIIIIIDLFFIGQTIYKFFLIV